MLKQLIQGLNVPGKGGISQWVIATLCMAILFTACDKKDEYKTDQLAEYMPLQVGKYWLYKFDSTKYVNANKIITHYQVKDIVDSKTVDNLNRPTYIILRYIRPADNTSENAWKTYGSYYVTPTTQTLETIDFWNFKYQSLKLPVTLNLTWKGNTYLPDFPYSEALPVSAAYNFTVDNGMSDWDYTYTGIGETASINGKTYNNVITVVQEDQSSNLLADNATPVDVNAFATRAYSMEKYAKETGLVSKKFELWEYQPPTAAGAKGYYVGFAIELQLIEHN